MKIPKLDNVEVKVYNNRMTKIQERYDPSDMKAMFEHIPTDLGYKELDNNEILEGEGRRYVLPDGGNYPSINICPFYSE